MTIRNPLSGCGVSRRDMMRIGAGGLGLGLFGGLGPVPFVLAEASRASAAATSGRMCSAGACATGSMSARPPR